jgi:predicted PurR-regulated permease PerM
MAVLAFGPSIGTGIVWGPAALYLFLQGSWIKAIILTAWGAGVVSTIDNFIYPIMVGHELRLHTLAVFVAFIGGMSALGVPGAGEKSA